MVSESMASPSAEEQNVAGGNLRDPAKARRRRFNIYKWGELGVDWGVCLVLAACAGGSAAVAFSPSTLGCLGDGGFLTLSACQTERSWWARAARASPKKKGC